MTTGYIEDAGADAAFVLARHAVALTYSDLPDGVADMTSKTILDTTGVILPASTTSPEAKALADLVLDLGGKQEATLLGFGSKAPAWLAGYVNGAMANCQDFSDLHPDAAHISSPVIPAAIALAERQGDIAGREFITSVVLGVDLQCRLTVAAGKPGGRMAPWHPAPLFGVFGAALACSKLLRLDENQTVNALGIAFTQAAGTHEIVFGKNSTIRGFGHAVPGEVGVRAALMAQAGISGVRRSFEGVHGLWNVYYQGEYDRDLLLGDLGVRYDVLEDGFKPWPSCAFTHVFIDMVRALMREHRFEPQEVESATVTVGDFARGQTEPLAEWRRPPNSMLAKLSVPFTVATALQRGDVTIADYFDEKLTDLDVLAMADRIESRYDEQYDFVAGSGFPGGEIAIRLRDGRTLTRQQPRAYGHPLAPMTWDGLIAKFKDCAGYAARPIPGQALDRAVTGFRELESIDDVGELFALLG
ncbi:MmgE/PrpD family protein [Nocardia vermiculata]|uniref:MmgE/PrpD family protein n=1 Tax=Nocardia vermiculata TaxID=257274 RepID=A0A846YAZ3_9NOCA|nr:MmgE/PrpD family protein [Nocardia vermiculata]NKY54358.1 MmgE/PrpD family protein [Nocardia vermiculata]